jgi:iron-sulfur cluster repair protein YtfE (RIC family)
MLAQLIKKDAPEYKGLPTDIDGKISYTLKIWNEELKNHFKNEESILFPAISGKNEEIDRLINELKNEHSLIELRIIEMNDPTDSEKQLDDLGNLLELHIRKEERILFQQLQIHCLPELEDLEGKILQSNKGCHI